MDILRAIVLLGIGCFVIFLTALVFLAKFFPLPLGQRVKVAAVFTGVSLFLFVVVITILFL